VASHAGRVGTSGNTAGPAIAYLAVGSAGIATWLVGKRFPRLSRSELEAMINSVIIVNTGYLGLPMAVMAGLLASGMLAPYVLVSASHVLVIATLPIDFSAASSVSLPKPSPRTRPSAAH
jgi:predicted permease